MSHLETLDYEPKLVELDGQPMPPSITQGQPIAQLQGEELIPACALRVCIGIFISEFLRWRTRCNAF